MRYKEDDSALEMGHTYGNDVDKVIFSQSI